MMPGNETRSQGPKKRVLALLSPRATPEPQPTSLDQSSSKSEKPTRKRKKHTKSRYGCFPCKARKIKCDESQPSCSQCIERQLKCASPGPSDIGHTIVSRLEKEDSPSPLQVATLNSTGQIFTMFDMQSFHAFLFEAFPNQPFGNQAVWLTRIPSIAYKNEFLMHAMLSDGSLFLHGRTEQNMWANAVRHRLQAISGVKQAMVKFDIGNCTTAECDALVAAVWLLGWQSVFFPDGIEEFRTLQRGAAIILGKLWAGGLDTSFWLMLPDNIGPWLRAEYGDNPPIDPVLFRRGLESIQELKSLCETDSKKRIQENIEKTMKAGISDPYEAISAGASILIEFARMSTPAYSAFVGVDDPVFQILCAHLDALQLIFLPIANGEWIKGKFNPPKRPALTNAIEAAMKRLKPEMKHYIDWPLEIRRRVLNVAESWPLSWPFWSEN